MFGRCFLQALPGVLSAQQLAAYQQQALQAWAVTAQQSLPSFQLLQGLAAVPQSQPYGGLKTEQEAKSGNASCINEKHRKATVQLTNECKLL